MDDNREKALVDLILEEYLPDAQSKGFKKKPKPLKTLMKTAGYKPDDILAPIKKESLLPDTIKHLSGIDMIVSLMEDTREKAMILANTDDKLREMTALQLITIADVLTKNSLLLTGKETEKKGITVNVTTYGESDPLLAAINKNIIEGEILNGDKAPAQLDPGEAPTADNQ